MTLQQIWWTLLLLNYNTWWKSLEKLKNNCYIITHCISQKNEFVYILRNKNNLCVLPLLHIWVYLLLVCTNKVLRCLIYLYVVYVLIVFVWIICAKIHICSAYIYICMYIYTHSWVYWKTVGCLVLMIILSIRIQYYGNFYQLTCILL